MDLTIHSDEFFMKEALKLAEQALKENEIPVGAVVVCSNRIIARAHNQVEQLSDSTAHAEMLALTSAFNYLGAKYLHDCSIYVTMEPCCMCAGALFWAQIGKVVYALHDPKRGFSRLQENILHPKTEVVAGILSKESKQIIDKFFNTLRN